MSDHTSDFDPEMAELLQRAQPYPDAPVAVRSRVRDAVMLRIAEATSLGSTDVEETADGYSATPTSPTSTGSSTLWSWAARPAWSIAATFIVGTATGASLHAVLRPPHDRVVYVERASVPRVRSIPELPAPVPPVTSEIPATPTKETASRPVRRTTPDKRLSSTLTWDLEVEQKLLDSARTALAQGRAVDALAPLDRHAQRYASGILAEEREALAINVLVTLGRYDEARDRSARFLRRYPDSLLRAAVEAAIAAIP
jgi:hypothetical protein